MKLRCGLKANLPVTAAPGEPLVTTDTQEMYIGTGAGIKKISDVVVSETTPVVADNLKLWMNPLTNIMSAYVNGAWEQVNNQCGTDFGTF